MAERIDDLHRRGYKLIQDDENFRFGSDAVLLSGFAKVKKNETTLDLGCGTGVIPVLLCAKTDGKRFTGIELQQQLADMARRSVELNGLSGRIDIINGDIKNIKNIFRASSFDVVTVNPPYVKKGAGVPNESERMSSARHETDIDLRGIVSAAAWVLRYGGRLYMVHKPDRLVEIISLLTEYKLEMKTLRFVQAYADKKPSMALIEATLHGNPQLAVLPPLVIYKAPGVYTDEVDAIYYGEDIGGIR